MATVRLTLTDTPTGVVFEVTAEKGDNENVTPSMMMAHAITTLVGDLSKGSFFNEVQVSSQSEARCH